MHAGVLSATAAIEAAELEQRRNDVRAFLEDAGEVKGGGGGGGGQSSRGNALLNQQLSAIIDVLAGVRSTEQLLAAEQKALEGVGVGGGGGWGGEGGCMSMMMEVERESHGCEANGFGESVLFGTLVDEALSY
jgi:hypothetical protein